MVYGIRVGKIGKVDPEGKVTEYTVGAENDAPTSLMEQGVSNLVYRSW